MSRKSSQTGRVPHLSLQISNSGETCALPCRIGPLPFTSSNDQEWVVVVQGLATVAMWHSSPVPTSAASKAALPADNSPICTRLRALAFSERGRVAKKKLENRFRLSIRARSTWANFST